MSKIGRNDPCPCGSGKKYKKCCINKQEESTSVVETQTDEWEDEEIAPLFNEYDEEDDFDDINYETESNEGEDEYEDDEEKFYPELSEETKNEIKKYSKKVDEDYPELSKEDEKKVDDWWDKYKKLDDPKAIKEHLEGFLANNSIDLIINLGLEHEVLFELIGDYAKIGKTDEIISFLINFRNKYPEVYHRSAGYYDFDIIAWLLIKNRKEDIPNYLNYFKEYPVNFVDKLFETINILHSTNNSKLIAPIINKIYKVIWYSNEVWGGYEIADFPVYEIVTKALKKDYCKNDINNMIDDLKKLDLDFESYYYDTTYWERRFNMFFREFEPWETKIPTKKGQYFKLVFGISENFARYLKEVKNIDFISTIYYSKLYENYCESSFREKQKPKALFDFSKKQMEAVIVSMSKDFMWINSIMAFSLCNMLYYFAEYLFTCGNYDEISKDKMQQDVKELFDLTYKIQKESHNIETGVYEKFPLFD